LLALALVGSAGLILLKRSHQTWTVCEVKIGDKLFPDFQFNDVAEIHFKGDGADFNMVRSNGAWRVRERSGYPANFPLIKDFLFRIKDLKVVQSDWIGPSQLALLTLNEPNSATNGGTLVEFKDERGKVLAALLAGKLHPKPQKDSEPTGLHGLWDGRYILLPGDAHNVLLISDDLIAISPEPGDWLNPDFFKAENIKFISLVSTNAADSWEMSRDGDSAPWNLSNPNPGEILNLQLAADISEILAFPSFKDVAPKTPTLLANGGLDNPTIVTILTDGFAYRLKVGHKGADGNYPIIVSVEANIPTDKTDASALNEKFAREQALSSWVYEAGPWIERVIRKRSELVSRTTSASGQTAAR